VSYSRNILARFRQTDTALDLTFQCRDTAGQNVGAAITGASIINLGFGAYSSLVSFTDGFVGTVKITGGPQVLEALVEPDPASGEVWSEEEKELALAQVNKLTAGSNIVFDPVQGNSIRITKGDSYSNSNGRALDIPMPEAANWPTDLTGWTITFTANRTAQCEDTTGDASVTFAGSVLVATGPGRTVRLEPTATDTAKFSIGNGSKGYAFDIRATSGAEVATLLRGLLSVDRQQ
jgi:hypothetical protein